MAEPENLDDEFFADLYDDNDAAPHAGHKAQATDEAMGDAPNLDGWDDTCLDTHEHNGNGNGEPHDTMEDEGGEEDEEEEEDDDDIDFNLGNTAAHVPTAGITSHHDSPIPSSAAPQPPPQAQQQQPSYHHNHHHHHQGYQGHQGHQKNSSSKEDG